MLKNFAFTNVKVLPKTVLINFLIIVGTFIILIMSSFI